jgi:hypothetical protein
VLDLSLNQVNRAVVVGEGSVRAPRLLADACVLETSKQPLEGPVTCLHAQARQWGRSRGAARMFQDQGPREFELGSCGLERTLFL